MKREFLDTLQLDENHERECKLAEGGFPEGFRRVYGRPIRHLQIQMVEPYFLM